MKKEIQIIVVYVPAFHAGYVNFFNKYSDSMLYLVGSDILEELKADFSYYGRDIRAVDPGLMQNVIRATGLVAEVGILDTNAIKELNEINASIVAPDEGISREICSRYFSEEMFSFDDSIFLRWGRKIAQKENDVTPDRVISEEAFDREIIKLAVDEAKKSSDWWRQVGAVIVKDENAIMYAYNKHMPDGQNPNILGDPRSNFMPGERIDLCTAIHAEDGLISHAAKEGIALNGTSIYVSTFPCPGCARKIVESGIKKVYYAEGYSLLDAEQLFNKYNVEIVLVK